MPQGGADSRERCTGTGATDRRRLRRGGRRISDLATHDERFITPQQLAEYLSEPLRQVHKWIQAGVLPAYRFGERTWRIELSEAVVFIRKSRFQPDQTEP